MARRVAEPSDPSSAGISLGVPLNEVLEGAPFFSPFSKRGFLRSYAASLFFSFFLFSATSARSVNSVQFFDFVLPPRLPSRPL